MANDYAKYENTVSAPAEHIAAVTPADDTDLGYATRALLVATAGNLKVTTVGGEAVTIPVVAGYNPLRVVRVWAASKTCGDVFALW